MKSRIVVLILMGLLIALLPVLAQDDSSNENEEVAPALLTDPFLQLPTEDGVYVVWFTEWEGSDHTVTFGDEMSQTATADSFQMSRTYEDAKSHVGTQAGDSSLYKKTTMRPIWRHEAYVEGLTAGERVPYFVSSVSDDGTEVRSETYSLQPLPAPGQPLKILMTSDHQLKPMTPANLQKVVETVGMVDAVFMAGDLENVPDRASEWFDDARGNGFFPALQGRANYNLERSFERDGATYSTSKVYTGGALIQNAPLFPVIGNHEVMGRYIPGNGLTTQFNDPIPREVAAARYEELKDIINPNDDEAIKERWIDDNSFNTVTYEEIFTLPDNGPEGEKYYAIEYGDIYLISLYATRIWRTPSLGDNARGKYREPAAALNLYDNWGHGEFPFWDLRSGSTQYDWLSDQLTSDAYVNAPFKYVMLHHAIHGLGENVMPAFSYPERLLDYDEDGNLVGVRYEYPLDKDVLLNDVEPLLNDASVDVVHNGHSHLWNLIENDAGVAFIETANVGNNYGCYLPGYKERGNTPVEDTRYEEDNYVLSGDHGGLDPMFPSEFAPQQDDNGDDLPCINSNDMTVFTILDTADGMMRSYVFDVTNPDAEVILFDEYKLNTDN